MRIAFYKYSLLLSACKFTRRAMRRKTAPKLLQLQQQWCGGCVGTLVLVQYTISTTTTSYTSASIASAADDTSAKTTTADFSATSSDAARLWPSDHLAPAAALRRRRDGAPHRQPGLHLHARAGQRTHTDLRVDSVPAAACDCSGHARQHPRHADHRVRHARRRVPRAHQRPLRLHALCGCCGRGHADGRHRPLPAARSDRQSDNGGQVLTTTSTGRATDGTTTRSRNPLAQCHLSGERWWPSRDSRPV